MNGYVGNPLTQPHILTPDIDWDMQVNLTATNQSLPFLQVAVAKYALTIVHDCYPAHELSIAWTDVYSYVPVDSSHLASCLAGFNQIRTIQSGTVNLQPSQAEIKEALRDPAKDILSPFVTRDSADRERHRSSARPTDWTV